MSSVEERRGAKGGDRRVRKLVVEKRDFGGNWKKSAGGEFVEEVGVWAQATGLAATKI